MSSSYFQNSIPPAPEDLARKFQKIANDFLVHSDISRFPLGDFLKLLGVSVVKYLRKDPNPSLAVHTIFEDIIESLSRDDSTKRILLSNKAFLPSILPLVCSSTLHWQCRQNTLELLCSTISLKISIECRMGLLINHLNYFDQVAQVSTVFDVYRVGIYPLIFLSLLAAFHHRRLRLSSCYPRIIDSNWRSKRWGHCSKILQTWGSRQKILWHPTKTIWTNVSKKKIDGF